jgi:hypothetical protein
MEITLDMPMIEVCNVSACTYNLNLACHAKAITVGDGVTPGCDTYMHSSRHVSNAATKAGVGACKVSACRHNTDFECGADSINVGSRDEGVFCMTFKAI